jgi:hypothetical protein
MMVLLVNRRELRDQIPSANAKTDTISQRKNRFHQPTQKHCTSNAGTPDYRAASGV